MADWRDAARGPLSAAMAEKDQPKFGFLLVELMFVATPDDIETFAYELLDTMDHDTQMWWKEECNCDGHLN